MSMKRNKAGHSIRQRTMTVMLSLCVGALIFTGLLWFGSLVVVRNQVASDSKELGDTAYQISSGSMKEITENNYIVTAQNRAQTIDATLERYLGYVGDFAFYVHRLYENPEEYIPKEVLPPDAKKAYKYTMQLCYADEAADKEALSDEVGLLANVFHVWQPLMESQDSQVASLYLCTESGFMINYDERSDLTPDIFDYYKSAWYIAARDQKKTILTDVYPDTFGRGLMVTCASPFYDKAGDFAGVACIDLMIDDMKKILSDVDLGDGSHAYVVDGEGNIIVSPETEEGEKTGKFTQSERVAERMEAHIISGKSGGEYGGSEGSVFFAYSPIKSANWMLIFQIPSKLITDPAIRTASKIEKKTAVTIESIHHCILIALLLLIVVISLVHIAVTVMSRRFAGQLARPLLELGRDVSIISGGDLDHQAEICDIDEIGDLARAFNDMAVSLDEHIRHLTRVTAERERIGAELDVARHIQASMLPCIFPPFPDREEFDIYASMNPAKEVGGDFYDFFMVDERHLAVVMADVSGKGVPAALFMVIGKTLIKDHTRPGADLGAVFGEVNNLLCASNSEGMFITAFEGVLDLVTGEFCYANAGHEMPFISHAGETFRPYGMRPGFVLAGVEDMHYESGSLLLEPGDKLFQYTDGVTEATDQDEQLYGMERLESVLAKNSGGSPEEILGAVKADIDRFVGEAEQFDDITMLALEFKKKMN